MAGAGAAGLDKFTICFFSCDMEMIFWERRGLCKTNITKIPQILAGRGDMNRLYFRVWMSGEYSIDDKSGGERSRISGIILRVGENTP